jgi:hypothetical protein
MKRLSRQLRLAYLVELLYRRLIGNKGGVEACVRYTRLSRELEKEIELQEVEGFIVNGRFVRRGSK